MVNQTGNPSLAAFNEATRSYEAIGTEVRNYSERVFADSTEAFSRLTKAASATEYFGIVSSYSKKLAEEGLQQMARLSGMYASAASDQARAVQSLMLQARK